MYYFVYNKYFVLRVCVCMCVYVEDSTQHQIQKLHSIIMVLKYCQKYWNAIPHCLYPIIGWFSGVVCFVNALTSLDISYQK